jgi:Raf kinase inhibitor-like YbhB/YbcL family protein
MKKLFPVIVIVLTIVCSACAQEQASAPADADAMPSDAVTQDAGAESADAAASETPEAPSAASDAPTEAETPAANTTPDVPATAESETPATVPSAAAAVTEAPASVPPATSAETPATVPQEPAETPEKREMAVLSAGVAGGALADEYGMRGAQQGNGVPTRSLPLSIKNAPEGTVCYALAMIDPDSKPLCGYEWVHWLAAGFTESELAANASLDAAADMAQGANDFGATGYGGPTPPDKPHTYVVTVYALDAKPQLQNGFSLSELSAAIEGHVLAKAVLKARYDN